MRFVPVKTLEQQSALMMHRARDLLIRQRTMLVNALRGHLAEFGLIEAQGLHKVAKLIAIVTDENDGRVPEGANRAICPLGIRNDHMPEVKADIDYVVDEGITTFSANTPAGEAFLEAPTVTAPSAKAAQIIEKAKAKGLAIV